MKRFSKIKTKKGFTLLETLLATCILVIVGSMLMEGFISTMGYSYNSSVYSRSAAYNSQLCMTKLANWSMKADGVSSLNADNTINAESRPYFDVGSEGYTQSGSFSNLRHLSFGDQLGWVRIVTYEENDVKTGAANLSNFTAEAIRNNDNAVADNRTILFYYPTNNGQDPSKSYFGNTHVYVKNDGTYVWGYDDASQPNGVKVLGNKVKLTSGSNT